MYDLATGTVVINAPTPRVFNFVSDMLNYKEWFPGVIEIELHPETSDEGGSLKRYAESIQLPGGNSQILIQVVKFEQDVLFQTQGSLPGISPQMTVTFADLDGQSTLMAIHYGSREKTLAPELLDSLRNDLSDRCQLGLSRLKASLEGVS